MAVERFTANVAPEETAAASGKCFSHKAAMSWPGTRQLYARNFATNKRAKTCASGDVEVSSSMTGDTEDVQKGMDTNQTSWCISPGWPGRHPMADDVSLRETSRCNVASPPSAQRAHSDPGTIQYDSLIAPSTPPMLQQLLEASPPTSPTSAMLPVTVTRMAPNGDAVATGHAVVYNVSSTISPKAGRRGIDQELVSSRCSFLEDHASWSSYEDLKQRCGSSKSHQRHPKGLLVEALHVACPASAPPLPHPNEVTCASAAAGGAPTPLPSPPTPTPPPPPYTSAHAFKDALFTGADAEGRGPCWAAAASQGLARREIGPFSPQSEPRPDSTPQLQQFSDEVRWQPEQQQQQQQQQHTQRGEAPSPAAAAGELPEGGGGGDDEGDDPSLVVTLMVLGEVHQELQQQMEARAAAAEVAAAVEVAAAAPAAAEGEWGKGGQYRGSYCPAAQGFGAGDQQDWAVAAMAAGEAGAAAPEMPLDGASSLSSWLAPALPDTLRAVTEQLEEAEEPLLPQYDIERSPLWRVGPPYGRPPLPPRRGAMGMRRLSMATAVSSELCLITAAAVTGPADSAAAATATAAAYDACCSAYGGPSAAMLPDPLAAPAPAAADGSSSSASATRCALKGGDSPFGRAIAATWGLPAAAPPPQEQRQDGAQVTTAPAVCWGGSEWTRRNSPFAELAHQPAEVEVEVEPEVQAVETRVEAVKAQEVAGPAEAEAATSFIPPRPASPGPDASRGLAGFPTWRQAVQRWGQEPGVPAVFDGVTAGGGAGGADAADASSRTSSSSSWSSAVGAAEAAAMPPASRVGSPMDDDELDQYYLNTLCGGCDPLAAFMQQELARSLEPTRSQELVQSQELQLQPGRSGSLETALPPPGLSSSPPGLSSSPPKVASTAAPPPGLVFGGITAAGVPQLPLALAAPTPIRVLVAPPPPPGFGGPVEVVAPVPRRASPPPPPPGFEHRAPVVAAAWPTAERRSAAVPAGSPPPFGASNGESAAAGTGPVTSSSSSGPSSPTPHHSAGPSACSLLRQDTPALPLELLEPPHPDRTPQRPLQAESQQLLPHSSSLTGWQPQRQSQPQPQPPCQILQPWWPQPQQPQQPQQDHRNPEQDLHPEQVFEDDCILFDLCLDEASSDAFGVPHHLPQTCPHPPTQPEFIDGPYHHHPHYHHPQQPHLRCHQHHHHKSRENPHLALRPVAPPSPPDVTSPLQPTQVDTLVPLSSQQLRPILADATGAGAATAPAASTAASAAASTAAAAAAAPPHMILLARSCCDLHAAELRPCQEAHMRRHAEALQLGWPAEGPRAHGHQPRGCHHHYHHLLRQHQRLETYNGHAGAEQEGAEGWLELAAGGEDEELMVLALERVRNCPHCSVAGDVRRLVRQVVWDTCFGEQEAEQQERKQATAGGGGAGGDGHSTARRTA